MLLTGAQGEHWARVADDVARDPGITLTVHRVGTDRLTDPTGTWATRYGVSDSGAVLVRPDRCVAWRSRGGAEPDALAAALRRILDR